MIKKNTGHQKIPMNQQAKAVKQLRRKGMTEANNKLNADNNVVLHFEKRGKLERKIANSVMCSECNTILSRSFFHRHRQTCKRTALSATILAIITKTCFKKTCLLI